MTSTACPGNLLQHTQRAKVLNIIGIDVLINHPAHCGSELWCTIPMARKHALKFSLDDCEDKAGLVDGSTPASI